MGKKYGLKNRYSHASSSPEFSGNMEAQLVEKKPSTVRNFLKEKVRPNNKLLI